jgi:hypothetical protein
MLAPSFEIDSNRPTSSKESKKTKFTLEEDKLLDRLVCELGVHNWAQISERMGTRNPRQCRERWNNYVRSDLRNDPFTPEEDRMLEIKFAEFGSKWNKISKFFYKRSDNSIRNRWMLLSRKKSNCLSSLHSTTSNKMTNFQVNENQDIPVPEFFMKRHVLPQLIIGNYHEEHLQERRMKTEYKYHPVNNIENIWDEISFIDF